VSAASLRALRDALVDDPALPAERFGAAYARGADEWLATVAAEATAGARGTWALMAVGGYGRGELAPFSDLDCVFVHDGTRGLAERAERVWYPVWDEAIGLDHAVRTVKEALVAARGDLRVALGLLEARCVAGEASLVDELLDRVRVAWHDDLAGRHLGELHDRMAERHARNDDIAFLLEPDLKEARAADAWLVKPDLVRAGVSGDVSVEIQTAEAIGGQ